jgi:hypothetical protein
MPRVLLPLCLLLWTGCREKSHTPTALGAQVQAALKLALPGKTVEVVDEHRVSVREGAREAQVGLDNLRQRCPGDEAGCAAAITVAVAQVTAAFEGDRAPARPLEPSAVLPTLKDDAWLQRTDALLQRRPERYDDNKLVTRPFGGGLQVVYVVDEPNGQKLLSARDVRPLGLTPDALHALALENLARAFPALTPTEPLGASEVFTNTEDENAAAALLLLPRLWAPLARQVQGRLVVALPSRNRFFATGDASPERLTRMRRVVATARDGEDHALVETLSVWSETGFTPLP